MPRQTYLQRRKNAFSFRIGVPHDLRHVIGSRELTKALTTQDYRYAQPIALQLAAQALKLFNTIRMAKKKSPGNSFDYSCEISPDELGLWKAKFTDVQPQDTQAVIEITQEINAQNDVKRLRHELLPVNPPPTNKQNTAVAELNLKLSEAIRSYMADYSKGKSPMLKKHGLALPLFLDIVGDMPIIELRQSHISDFFKLIQKLPPQWKVKTRQQMISVRELSLQEHPETMSKPTFKGTYRASVNLFLTEVIRLYKDRGFIATLTTKDEDYKGTRGGENKQRALKHHELKRLFEGEELQRFASNPSTVHQFWLPVLGLYTGARVNEIAQLNPQTDIIQDPDSGIWCLLITEDTEAGDGVIKSVKKHVNRAIPVHPKLIELGFLKYVEAIKNGEHGKLGRLFPAWTPRDGRAGNNAMRWFSRFLLEVGLHGVENEKGLSLRGMHAFRHTLLTYGKLHKVNGERRPLNLRCISGHKQRSDNPVADGYEDETLLDTLADKQALLCQLDYGLTFPTPVLPA